MEKIDFVKADEALRFCSVNMGGRIPHFHIKNADGLLKKGLENAVGESAVWLPEYDKVAEYLSNNKGKGLLCYGNCGRGKTLLCRHVIIPILYHVLNRVTYYYDASEMNKSIDAIKRTRYAVIDDIGIEGIAVDYGERRMAVPEIVDNAEKNGNLLILTTNLSFDEMNEKYGTRTMDRLASVCHAIRFKGESLRR